MFEQNASNKESYTTKFPLKLDLQLFGEGDNDSEMEVQVTETPNPAGPEQKPITFEDVTGFLENAKSDVLFKIPAIKSLVEHARTEEKDKVYKSLGSKDEKIKKLEEDLALATKALENKENDNLSEQEVLQRHVKALETQLKSLTDSIEAERTASNEEKRLAKFEAYKEKRLRKLAEEGTEYLPDLIGGITEEEFESSINKAITRYAELKAQLLENAKPNTPPKPSTPSVTNPAGSNTKPLSLRDIKNMPTDEWAKNRERALKEATQGNLEN